LRRRTPTLGAIRSAHPLVLGAGRP